ncbi:extracellular solute-binding protein [Brachybacterium sp. DNPG3]
MNHQIARRTALTGSAAALAALGLASCGIGGGTTETDTGSGEVTGSIRFQTWNLKGGYEEYFTALIAAFEKEYPGTSVEWIDQPPEGYQDSLSADAAAGNLPDVVDMGPEAAYSLASAGMLVDLAAEDPSLKDGFLPAAWEAMTFAGLGGGTYGFPWYLNTGPSFFNTALFEAAGLDPENLPATYDELFEQAAVMGEASDASMIGRLPAIETFGTYGVQLMNDEGTAFTFNEDRGVQLLQHYIDLYQGEGFTEESLNALQTGELDAFKAGELGWLPGSSYTMKELRETAPDIAETVAVAPAIADSAPNMYIESLTVSSQSTNLATALAFAAFATNPENQMEFATQASVFPSNDGALEDARFTEDDGTDDGAIRVQSAAQVKEAVVWWPPAFSGESSAVYLQEQIGQALLGQKTAQEALDAAVSYADDRIVTADS